MEVVVKQKKKRGKGKRIVIWSGSIILVLLVATAIFANAFVMKSMPKVEGTVHVSGLQKSVQVTRDEKGVPHIKAENAHDLYFSQGYVQAQDRLF